MKAGRLVLLLHATLLWSLISCGGGSSAPGPPSPPAAAACSSGYFPCQQGWLGADSAYSVDLGSGRSLWLFGDTFIGPASATNRAQTTGFIRNSIAISTCSANSCTFQYFWPGMGTSSPETMFVAPGTDWFWPMDGFVHNGTLYLALMQMHTTSSGGAFGFAYSGAQLASIANYTDPPSQWTINYQPLNTGEDAIPGATIVVGQGPDGNPDPSNPQGADYAYFFTVVPVNNASPSMALLRLPLDQLNSAARPGSTAWEYLKQDANWASWPEADTTLPSDVAAVINSGATEMTVRYHNSTNQWIAVYPVGLDNKAHYSLSSSLTGGWGATQDLFSYPEMQPGNANYTPNVFCYAAKEHVELETAGKIFVTYACNSVQASDVTQNMNLYRPVVVVQALPSM